MKKLRAALTEGQDWLLVRGRVCYDSQAVPKITRLLRLDQPAVPVAMPGGPAVEELWVYSAPRVIAADGKKSLIRHFSGIRSISP